LGAASVCVRSTGRSTSDAGSTRAHAGGRIAESTPRMAIPPGECRAICRLRAPPAALAPRRRDAAPTATRTRERPLIAAATPGGRRGGRETPGQLGTALPLPPALAAAGGAAVAACAAVCSRSRGTRASAGAQGRGGNRAAPFTSAGGAHPAS
jgi:hypothetical protein